MLKKNDYNELQRKRRKEVREFMEGIHTIQVNVLYRDIRRGCRADSENCPVARAVARALKKRLRPRFPDADVLVCVYTKQVTVAKPAFRLFSIPEKITAFIVNFDNYERDGWELIRKAIGSLAPDSDVYLSFDLQWIYGNRSIS